MGPENNNCRVNETKTNEKISAWDHLPKISQKIHVQAPQNENDGKIDEDINKTTVTVDAIEIPDKDNLVPVVGDKTMAEIKKDKVEVKLDMEPEKVIKEPAAEKQRAQWLVTTNGSSSKFFERQKEEKIREPGSDDAKPRENVNLHVETHKEIDVNNYNLETETNEKISAGVAWDNPSEINFAHNTTKHKEEKTQVKKSAGAAWGNFSNKSFAPNNGSITVITSRKLNGISRRVNNLIFDDKSGDNTEISEILDQEKVSEILSKFNSKEDKQGENRDRHKDDSSRDFNRKDQYAQTSETLQDFDFDKGVELEDQINNGDTKKVNDDERNSILHNERYNRPSDNADGVRKDKYIEIKSNEKNSAGAAWDNPSKKMSAQNTTKHSENKTKVKYSGNEKMEKQQKKMGSYNANKSGHNIDAQSTPNMDTQDKDNRPSPALKAYTNRVRKKLEKQQQQQGSRSKDSFLETKAAAQSNT